ncbi:MAG TPA: N-acetyltransferase [Aestuariivirgaceae bacterium]|jgi:predicted N-acetyltransferase YhbS
MVTIRQEGHADRAAREELLNRVFGKARFLKTCEQLRYGRLPSPGLSFGAYVGRRLVGTLRMWDIIAGAAGRSLLLGPLAVAPEMQGRGIGSDLIRHAIHEATLSGHESVLLVGDAPYYRRFGFSAAQTGGLVLPGPVERARFQGLELRQGALANASGLVVPAGQAIVPARNAESSRIESARVH